MATAATVMLVPSATEQHSVELWRTQHSVVLTAPDSSVRFSKISKLYPNSTAVALVAFAAVCLCRWSQTDGGDEGDGGGDRLVTAAAAAVAVCVGSGRLTEVTEVTVEQTVCPLLLLSVSVDED